MVSQPILDFPQSDHFYALFTKASFGDDHHKGGFGAIFTQINEKTSTGLLAMLVASWLVVHKKNYTPFLLEMQAAIFDIEHFGIHLKGRHFTFITDHKPLEKFGKCTSVTLNQLLEIMNGFNSKMVCIKGKDISTDFLSLKAVEAA